ncbi:MAG: glutathione S-transferase family protein [Pseudomonadota bacterium]
MLVLEHPLSPYAQKVKIALREKNVPFETAVPEGLGAGSEVGQQSIGTVRGEVPVLIVEEGKIFDSTIILEYIEQRWPTPRLLPDSPFACARARMIEDVMDTHFEAINWGLIEVNFFGRADGELKDVLVAAAGRQLAGLYDWLETQLDPSGWFNGPGFGWADLSVIPYVNCSVMLGFSPVAGSRVESWLAAVNARPSVALTAQEALAAVPEGDAFKQALHTQKWRREYRDHRLEWMIKSGGMSIVLDGLQQNNIRFSAEALART